MIDLPVGLAPWARHLASLPMELALALAPWVGRLSLAVGPFADAPHRRAGEPDGYRGLARRGSYERLVATEWGIADQFPDEFLRRASAGEHLFLDLARTEPRGALRSIVIVSVGPSQLGAPRLAQLAALVVFARRAANAGASFQWGVLEDDEHRLFDVLDETTVQRWLHARTALAASPDAMAAWLAALGLADGDDVWFVGGATDAAVARAAHVRTLEVRDVLDPYVRALEVDVGRAGNPSRVRLDLPPTNECARLLRDPYRRDVAGPRVTATSGRASRVWFAQGSRRLLMQLDDGVVESWPIPNSPRDKLGAPQRWMCPRGHSLVCVGLAGRRSILAATVSRDEPMILQLSYSSSHHRTRVTVPSHVAAILVAESSSLPVRSCGIVRLREGSSGDLLLDVCGVLLVVRDFTLWPPAETELDAVALHPLKGGTISAELRAMVLHSSSAVWAEQGRGPRVRVIEATSSGNRTLATLDRTADGPVLFGFSYPEQTSSWGVVAVPHGSDGWTLAASTLKPTRLHAVAPVVGAWLRRGIPVLLTRSNPYRLAWWDGEQRTLLPTASAPIASVSVSSTQPYVAWVTESGEVVVYSIQHEAVLMRRSPGESA